MARRPVTIGVFLRQFAANEKFDKWRTYADHARGENRASPWGKIGNGRVRLPGSRSVDRF